MDLDLTKEVQAELGALLFDNIRLRRINEELVKEREKANPKKMQIKSDTPETDTGYPNYLPSHR